MNDDRSDKFTMAPELFESSCEKCKWLAQDLPTHCTAFPTGDGIPEEIRFGDNDHTEAYPGDHGLRFEPITPKTHRSKK